MKCEMNADRMYENNTYLVRVATVAGTTDSFIWEICRGDGLQVLLRATKTFPTRIEALFDSARKVAALALDTVQDSRFLLELA